jgi:hypothetical protein
MSDELMRLIDRLLRDAYAAGMSGDEFDMLAARREVEEAETEQSRG